MAGFKHKKDKSESIEEQYAIEAARELAEEMDFSIISDLLVKTGWTKITTERVYWEPEDLFEIKKWMRANIKGASKVRKNIWLFESKKDATLFVLRWGYI